jgi:hypothetical protein
VKLCAGLSTSLQEAITQLDYDLERLHAAIILQKQLADTLEQEKVIELSFLFEHGRHISPRVRATSRSIGFEHASFCNSSNESLNCRCL